MFLPNWQSIVDVYEGLAEAQQLFERLLLFPLHSMMPMSEQQEVFEPAPQGEQQPVTPLTSWAIHLS